MKTSARSYLAELHTFFKNGDARPVLVLLLTSVISRALPLPSYAAAFLGSLSSMAFR